VLFAIAGKRKNPILNCERVWQTLSGYVYNGPATSIPRKMKRKLPVFQDCSSAVAWMKDICARMIERKRLGMASRFMTAVLGLFSICFAVNLHAGSIPSAPAPKLRSAAFIVQDQRTGEFLLAKQAETAMPIASITKLMTAMVILDAKLNMDATITIEESDIDILRHSHSHLPVGMRLTRREALRIALMASENRAAHALGRTYPGGVRALIHAMNEKARSLGLNETRFDDPTGLSDKNISSAQDLSRLVDMACRYPEICAFSTQQDVILQHGKKRLRFVNTNALVRNPHWQIGLSKTGYIEEGGRCLVMQTLLAQRPVLIVLLNSTGKNTRLADANRIKQWMEKSESSEKAQKSKAHNLRHL
jgi:serine-type D-Ala-D-Ala endopeptidase (penicillin-binding protein 7)